MTRSAYLQNSLEQLAPLSFGRFMNGDHPVKKDAAAVCRVAHATLPLLALYSPTVNHLTTLASGIYGVQERVRQAFDPLIPRDQRAKVLARGILLVVTLVSPFFSSRLNSVMTTVTGVIDAIDLLKGIQSDLLRQRYPQAVEKLMRIAVVGCSVAAAHTKLAEGVFALALCQTAVCIPQAWREYQEKGGLEAAITCLIACIRLQQTHQCALALLSARPRQEAAQEVAPKKIPTDTDPDAPTGPLDTHPSEAISLPEDTGLSPEGQAGSSYLCNKKREFLGPKLANELRGTWLDPKDKAILCHLRSKKRELLGPKPANELRDIPPEPPAAIDPPHLLPSDSTSEGSSSYTSDSSSNTDSASSSSTNSSSWESEPEPQLNRLSDTMEHCRITASPTRAPSRLYTHIVHPEEYSQLERIASVWEQTATNRQSTETNNLIYLRLGDCGDIASYIASDCNTLASKPDPNAHFIVCTTKARDEQNTVAGIMEYSLDEGKFWIDYLVTNPQNIGATGEMKGAGSALLERAQLEAQTAGFQDICLLALRRARTFYLQQGFVPAKPGSNRMILHLTPQMEDQQEDQEAHG